MGRSVIEVTDDSSLLGRSEEEGGGLGWSSPLPPLSRTLLPTHFRQGLASLGGGQLPFGQLIGLVNQEICTVLRWFFFCLPRQQRAH